MPHQSHDTKRQKSIANVRIKKRSLAGNPEVRAAKKSAGLDPSKIMESVELMLASDPHDSDLYAWTAALIQATTVLAGIHLMTARQRVIDAEGGDIEALMKIRERAPLSITEAMNKATEELRAYEYLGKEAGINWVDNYVMGNAKASKEVAFMQPSSVAKPSNPPAKPSKSKPAKASQGK